MTKSDFPVAVVAADSPPRALASIAPAPIAARLQGREKRPLGERFGLTNFGVNLTRLAPGAMSALRHAHTAQDEFVYILEGTPTLVTGAGRMPLAPGMCAGFRAGTGDAHHLVNETDTDVLFIEVGDRSDADSVTYPDDDLHATTTNGVWRFTRKDGTPY